MVQPLNSLKQKLILRKIRTIPSGTSVQQAALLFHQDGEDDSLVVVKDGKAAGVVNRSHFARVFFNGKDHASMTIDEIMSSPVVTLPLEASIEEAMELIKNKNLREICVTHQGRLIGVLTLSLLMNYIQSLYGYLKQRNQELQLQVYRDPLTGLFNKRYFFQRIKEEAFRLIKFGGTSALLFIDVDFFKQINDTYSHPAGDYILRKVGDLFDHYTRPPGLTVRYGGEEFVLMIPSCPPLQATYFANKIRVAVMEYPFRFRSQLIRVTISVGIASLSGTSPIKEVIDRADKALYEAKRTGRNRTFHWNNITANRQEKG